jgi:hypothetical protein
VNLYEIAVVGHVDRGPLGHKLSNRVKATCYCLDDGTVGAGHNHLRAWRWLAMGPAEWGVVLEDDAAPSAWFLSGDLSGVLENAPSPVVSLYLGRSSPRHWQPSISSVIARPESWLMGSELLHHVGVAIKTTTLPVLLDGVQRLLGTHPIDEALGLRCRKIGIPIAYCHPSIVDHDAEIPSVITEHRSQHPVEQQRRDIDRVAWMMVNGHTEWNNSQVIIPEPAF